MRDRLIAQAAARPDWVLGFQDETWWTRLALKRLGVGWKRAKHWLTSPDPEYARKKKCATG